MSIVVIQYNSMVVITIITIITLAPTVQTLQANTRSSLGGLRQAKMQLPREKGPTLRPLGARTCTGPKPLLGGWVAVEAAKGEQRQLWLWAHRQQTLPTVTHQSDPGDTYRDPRSAPFRSARWITQNKGRKNGGLVHACQYRRKRLVLDAAKQPWWAFLPYSTARHGKPTPKNCSSAKGPTQNSQFLEQGLEDLGPILP